MKSILDEIYVRSLQNNLPWFRDLVYLYNYDIFAITETWLNATTSSSAVNIPGYDIIRSDRPTPCGGVAVYYKSGLKVRNSETLSYYSVDIELLSVFITVPSVTHRNPLIITVVYRPPSANINTSLEELKSYMSPLLMSSTNLIFIGNFNVDFSYVNTERPSD